MAGTHPPTRGDLEKCKKLQKGGPGKFWFVKGGAEGFLHVLLGDIGTIFGGGCTPSAYHGTMNGAIL